MLPGRLPDAGPALAALAVEGYAVGALPMRDLASVLLEAASLRGRLGALDEAMFPGLRAIGRAIPDLRTVAAPVAAHVQPDGTIADAASAELHRIRVALGRTGDRLRRQLQSFLHDPESQPVIRDDFVTQRNGRFVIPVRSDAPRAVKGIVHAASSSGATLFVEPLESVELNNEIVRLTEAEAAELDRVLDRWAAGYRGRWDDVLAAVEGLVRADSLQARALFAEHRSKCFRAPVVGGLAIGSAASDTVKQVSEALEKLPDSNLKTQLQALVRTAGTTTDTLVKAVSDWADRSLTMLGGVYRRHLQKISIVIGLLIAVGFNIDTVALIQHLYRDKDARDAAVALGVQIAEKTSEEAFEKCMALTPQKRKEEASCASLTGLLDAVQGRNESLGKLPIGWHHRQGA